MARSYVDSRVLFAPYRRRAVPHTDDMRVMLDDLGIPDAYERAKSSYYDFQTAFYKRVADSLNVPFHIMTGENWGKTRLRDLPDMRDEGHYMKHEPADTRPYVGPAIDEALKAMGNPYPRRVYPEVKLTADELHEIMDRGVNGLVRPRR